MSKRLIFLISFLSCHLVVSAVATGQQKLPIIPEPSLLNGPHPTPPAVAPSVITLPISLSLRQEMAQAESTVPSNLDLMGAFQVIGNNVVGDVGLKYKILRDPIAFSVDGPSIGLRAQAHYAIEIAQRVRNGIFFGGYSWVRAGSCGVGEPLREVAINLQSTLGWSPNWQLLASTTVPEPQFQNRCQVTVLNIDQTNRVRDFLVGKLQDVGRTLDARINGLNLRQPAERAWAELQQPISLDPSGVWLLWRPESVGVAPIGGAGDTITTALSLVVRPTIVVGAQPAVVRVALPPLQQSTPPAGFRVVTEAMLPFDTAAHQLSAQLASQGYTSGSTQLRFRNPVVYGAGTTIIVRLDVFGTLTGTIFLRGRLTYDLAAQVLSAADLEYTLESKDAIANFLGALLLPDILSKIAEKARWPLRLPLDDLRSKLTQSMNRPLAPNVTLSGNVGEVRVLSISTTPTQFNVQFVVDGSASVAAQ